MDRTSSQPSPFEPTGDEHAPFSASVKTKDGSVVMLIQKPAKPLSTRSKPRVIVRRSDGELEMGHLLFTGKIGGKELAGVHLEIQRKWLVCTARVHTSTCVHIHVAVSILYSECRFVHVQFTSLDTPMVCGT